MEDDDEIDAMLHQVLALCGGRLFAACFSCVSRLAAACDARPPQCFALNKTRVLFQRASLFNLFRTSDLLIIYRFCASPFHLPRVPFARPRSVCADAGDVHTCENLSKQATEATPATGGDGALLVCGGEGEGREGRCGGGGGGDETLGERLLVLVHLKAAVVHLEGEEYASAECGTDAEGVVHPGVAEDVDWHGEEHRLHHRLRHDHDGAGARLGHREHDLHDELEEQGVGAVPAARQHVS